MQTDRNNGLIGNQAVKVPVRAATTVAITLSAEQTIDGVACVTGDRVLVKNQASAINNGIYVCDSGDWQRSQDCDGVLDMVEGTQVRVNKGSTQGSSIWVVTTTGTILPGTSSMVFANITTSLTGATAIGLALLTAASAAAARSTLSVPSNAEAVLQALADAKGDLIMGNAADVFVRKGSPGDGSFWVASAAETGGYTFTPHNMRSHAPNPFFQIDQRVNSATSRADDTYCIDRWYVLTQTAAIAVTQQSDQENGLPFNARLSQSQASAQRMGIACILESVDAKPLRGKNMTFTPRIRCSSSQAIRCAIVEWTGTLDILTSDCVNDWTSSTYTTGNFFVSANFAVNQAPAAITPAANTWTDLPGLVTTIGSTTTNIILFVWTEGVAAQNVTLDVSKARFVEGLFQGNIIVPDFADELNRCQRHYWTTFNYGIAPANGTDQYDGAIKYSVQVATAVNHSETVSFATMMRANPAITFFNPAAGGGAGKWRNFNDTADSGTATQLGIAGGRGFTAMNPQVAGDGVGEQCVVHAVAEIGI